MDQKNMKKILNLTREKKVLFVKDFRTMFFNELCKKYDLTSVFAAEMNNLVNKLITDNDITEQELLPEGK